MRKAIWGIVFLTICSMNIHSNFSFCLLKSQHYENQNIGENNLRSTFLIIIFTKASVNFYLTPSLFDFE